MIIFDFDGVLVNSVDEVLVTAYNTTSGSFATALDDIPSSFVSLFRNNRSRALRAGDIAVLSELLVANHLEDAEKKITQDEFDTFLSTRDLPVLDYEKKFFATRGSFFAQNRSAWRELNRPYKPLWPYLKEHDPASIVILTYKNKEAVMDLCHHFGLPVIEENIFSGDGGATKRENFLRIEKKFPNRHYHFVDDAFHNLKTLKKAFENKKNLTLLLAAWGYTAPDQLALAKEQGLPVFEQEQLIEFIEENQLLNSLESLE